jgi:hypothetical protein
MGRRKRDEVTGLGVIVLVIFGALGAAFEWANKNAATVITVLVVGAGIFVAIQILSARAKAKALQERTAYLLNKYRNQSIVDAILSRQIWEDQTEEQLMDSLGRPVEVDDKVLKTKTKQVWKYGQTGVGRFRTRITLENGRVVGWEQKG